jgi:hypothetical protein
MEKSGARIGAENVARLKEYLDRLAAAGEPFPTRGGRPNLSAVAVACGFDRQVLYKNPAAKALVDAAVAELGLASPSAGEGDGDDVKPEPRVDRRDRRIMQLEQQNASLRAENQSLRERLLRLEQVEEIMVQTGRRVAC